MESASRWRSFWCSSASLSPSRRSSPVAALSFFLAVEVAVSSPCYHLSRSDAWLPDDPVMKRLSAVTRKHRRLSHTRMPLPCGGPACGLPVFSRVQIARGPGGSTISVRGGRVYRSFRVCRSRGGRQGVCGYSRHTCRVGFTGPSACADRGGAGRECLGYSRGTSRDARFLPLVSLSPPLDAHLGR